MRGIHSGLRRPIRHSAPKATLGRMISSRTRFTFGRGAAGSSVRRLRFVSAHAVWGTQKNSTWSALDMNPSKSSRISSTRIGSSIACRRKAVEASIVTVETIPSAPTPYPRRGEHLRVLVGGALDDRAVTSDQSQRRDPAGDVAEVPAGAVGGRRRGAGDRLVADVAHVLEAEAADRQLV